MCILPTAILAQTIAIHESPNPPIGIVEERGNQILLVPLGGGPTRTIRPKGHSDLIDLSWANRTRIVATHCEWNVYRAILGALHASPASTMGIVGEVLPVSGSIVMANALACKSFGKGGMSTLALPWESGLKTPTGIGGAPLVGTSQSS